MIEGRLSEGWLLGGRKMDLSDSQWNTFRNAIPQLILLLTLHYTINKLLLHWEKKHLNGSVMEGMYRNRAILSVCGIFLLHGFNVFKVLSVVYISHLISQKIGDKRIAITVTWLYSISLLFLLEFCQLRDVPLIGWIDTLLLSTWKGFYPRWHVTFNMTILRLISFNLDHIWAKENKATEALATVDGNEYSVECVACVDQQYSCEKCRIVKSPPKECFTFAASLAYSLYIPLYIAGPIITFNNFHSQINLAHSKCISSFTKTTYCLRWIFALFCMEVMLHLVYPIALKDLPQISTLLSPTQLFILVYFNLKFLWLKLLIIWRFFRLAALLHNLDPPENMLRCVSNNYSGLAFWRAWHRSFNQWIIRYMYGPLGGRSTAMLSIWPIFLFVAIWHDVQPRLIAWSLLICLFLLPEIVIRRLVSQYYGGDNQRNSIKWWKVIEGAAASCNILFLVTANMVGFVGFVGINRMLDAHGWKEILTFLVGFLIVFYFHSRFMFTIRDYERSKGIKVNY